MITKRAVEEIFRYHEFKRDDGQGWLAAGEIINTPTVVCTNKRTGTPDATMISDVSVLSDTKIKYKLKGGTVGQQYILTFKAITNTPQTFEDTQEVRIV